MGEMLWWPAPLCSAEIKKAFVNISVIHRYNHICIAAGAFTGKKNHYVTNPV
jgi:hypothetical protein